ncbi:MAG TPA: LD-carboxypeptidase [Kofleriaceae bacterium]|nr:LD-carboxypeptidase [Kofleriaceae bacterium]
MAIAARPPKIERGQTLGIVAPGGPVKRAVLERGLAQLGDAFKLRVADSVLAPHPPGVPSYLSASDDVRAAELNAMLADRDVRAILLARGGYGLMRILPRLDVEALRRDPKPIIGFSDATALLAWAYAAGVRGVHGPMVVQLDRLPAEHITHMIDLISVPRAPGVRPWQLASHGKGRYRGPLVAGNLTMYSLLVGTPWEVSVRGAIAVIEEVGERPYELDRYLTQLALTGELAQLAAVVVGDLTRCVDANPPTGVPDPEDAALQTVLERLRAAGTAAAVGAPIGHGDRNEAVPFGADTILDLDAGTIEILDPAVD